MLNKNWTSITQASLTFYQMSRIIDNFSSIHWHHKNQPMIFLSQLHIFPPNHLPINLIYFFLQLIRLFLRVSKKLSIHFGVPPMLWYSFYTNFTNQNMRNCLFILFTYNILTKSSGLFAEPTTRFHLNVYILTYF